MQTHKDPASEAVEVLTPSLQTVPLVFASPHSGDRYPADLIAASALNPQFLRKSEDSFVDDLFGAAPRHGAPLVRALFPRAYVDPNREPYELDPTMFSEPLPSFVNTRSPRVQSGLGTIARVVASGAEIYRRKLTFAEVEHRIETLYRPFHRTLLETLEATKQRFGHYILIDCHSMPSVGGPLDQDSGLSRVDMVLGNCYGTSCSNLVTEVVETVLRNQGYRVLRNSPYAGGFITRHYGSPREGHHALQIEVNRYLYMDELRHQHNAGYDQVKHDLTEVVAALAKLAGSGQITAPTPGPAIPTP